MELGKEAIWIQSTVPYMHKCTVHMSTSLTALTNPTELKGHIPLPLLLLIWKRTEIDREEDRRKELSTYLPNQNLHVEGNQTLL